MIIQLLKVLVINSNHLFKKNCKNILFLNDRSTYIEFTSSHGLVGHRVSSNANEFSKPTVVVYYNVDYTRDAKGTNYIRNRVLKVAKKLADEGVKVHFTVSNAEEFRNELNEFGVNDVKKDGKYVLARGPKDEKYVLTEDFSFEALEDFARKVVAGDLEPYLKSEPIPEQTEGVQIVVAKNFDEIVGDETKDVLIEFYAPWCGHWYGLIEILVKKNRFNFLFFFLVNHLLLNMMN